MDDMWATDETIILALWDDKKHSSRHQRFFKFIDNLDSFHSLYRSIPIFFENFLQWPLVD